ncbi:MAG: DNA replication/repair protein RecF [Bacteroidia bacterium]|nr:DNA replication/repair protein RecF [Bacteroidia bacterium]
MYLRKLSVINFKNYPQADLAFDEGANCFVGDNGAGKTNLLDAIYYLSFCKSYFNVIDSQNILHGTPFFMIQGQFILGNREELISCGLKRNQKKIFRRNQNEYARLAEHIGLLPCVMISPYDIELITGGSEERRKFIDSIISQYDRIYLDDLINYNKALTQRNALLRQFSRNNSFDKESLAVWDDLLISLGTNLFKKRQLFLDEFTPLFNKHYKFISGEREEVAVVYDSHHHLENFAEHFANTLKRDLTLEYTTTGIHKDDLLFTMGGHSVKKISSQGQQKSFLISLKLAQFDFIKSIKNIFPLLLLDDVFDKLDDFRVNRLMELVSHDNFGQIFITDTHTERVIEIFNKIKKPIRTFSIENGMVT